MNDYVNWWASSWIAKRYRHVRNCLLGKISCDECPYRDGDCLDYVFQNANGYITALETEHKALLRDMALLVENLDKPNMACAFCRHYAKRKDAKPCNNCVNNNKWRWDARPREADEETLEAIHNKFTKDSEAKICTDESKTEI